MGPNVDLHPRIDDASAPLEIIEDGVSGFHIDPTQGTQNAERILEFLKRCDINGELWTVVSALVLRPLYRRVLDRMH